MATLKQAVREFEAEFIKAVLEQNEYNVTASSKVIGLTRKQVYKKIKDYNLELKR